MWSLCVLCVLCALLSPVQGQDPGISDHEDVFSRPGSDVPLPLRYNLTINKDNKSLCDRFTWIHESLRISRSKQCDLTVYKDGNFSNYKTSEDGDLTLSSVTRNNGGKYTVNVHKGGNEVFRHIYNLHVQDPVSEPLLQVSCLPDVGSIISCRTDTGTDAGFSIMVNGLLLLNSTSSRTMGNVTEVSVPVDLPGPWDITCSVRNRVSENETRKTGEKCPVPPSVPVLEASCLQDGGREISCSVENGSDLVFSLSVNGELEEVRKEEKRVNVTLSSSGPWTVNCSVRNDLGEKNNATTFPACPVSPSVPVLEVSCLQDGRSEVSCSVEKGTDLVFSLSANGKSLENVTREEKRVNVTLSSPGPWVVHCFVRNDHGEENRTETFRACSVPVPIINVSCHHDGSARGVCSVEDGTNVSYSWTVNGKTIAWNTGPNLTINASEFTSGAVNISCSAENSISEEQSNVTNIYCGVPVSVPIINVSCHHDGSVRGVCSVEDGTSVSYSWTVNGKIIAWNTGPNLTINASEFTSGAVNISCSAENSISEEQSNVTNIYCGASCWTCLQKSIIGGIVALIVITSPLLMASFYIGPNRKDD